MRAVYFLLTVCIISLIYVGSANASSANATTCAGKTDILGVTRVISLDTALGQRFGRMQYREDNFLADREVVLTFDDGPLPRYTRPILKALADHCTNATFFYVGRMAKAYPKMLKKVYAAGHTIAGHTYSHPLNLKKKSLAGAKYEIERGFLTLRKVLGHPIAPFFRFPGLSDSKPLMAYLRERGIGMFSVDVVSNDSYTRNPKRLAQQTMARLDKLGRGILLFHDIKASTARALPEILNQLHKKGYKIVHMTALQKFRHLSKDPKKLPFEIAKVRQKKWISFKMLTQGPIPLPVKRTVPLVENRQKHDKKSSGTVGPTIGTKIGVTVKATNASVSSIDSSINDSDIVGAVQGGALPPQKDAAMIKGSAKASEAAQSDKVDGSNQPGKASANIGAADIN